MRLPRPLRAAFAATVLLASAAQAQTASTCAVGTATADLAIGNVRARLYNTGGLFWRGAGNVYNVPKSPDGLTPTPNAIFAAGLWVGGYTGHEADSLRQAATMYGDWEFVPGPLTASGQPPADCTPYDRIFRVTRDDVAAYAGGAGATADLAAWPVAWGAPVVDGDGVPGNYNLAGGDRPALSGDETAWWVTNAMGAHASTGSAPWPLEVQTTAFAFRQAGDLGNTTVYRYRFVWRGRTPLVRAYAGFFADVDLGDAADDYVGADSALGLVYTYNADDADGGTEGYGTPPPALGFAVVPTAGSPPVASLQVVYKSAAAAGEPRANTDDWYKRLQALNRDGTPMYRCGNGYSPQFASCGTTRFLFTGDPAAGTGWTMRTPTPSTQPFAPSDYRMLASVGPFDLAPGAATEATFAVVYARGTNHLNSVTRLRDAVRAMFFPVGVAPEAAPATARLAPPVPNPTRGAATVRLTLPRAGEVRATLHDVLGRTLATLAAGPRGPGDHALTVPTAGLGPGLYVVRVETGAAALTRTVVVAQ